jgi:putative endopeptidase
VCSDFYTAVNAPWIRTHAPRGGEAYVDPFALAAQRNDREMLKLLQAAAADPGEAGTARRTAGDFYASCMNVAAIERAGNAPLAEELGRIDAVTDRSSMAAELARLHDRGIPAFFSIGPAYALRSGRVVAEIGPEMPTMREFAVLQSPPNDHAALKELVSYAWQLFMQAGDSASIAAGEAGVAVMLRLQLAAATGDENAVPQDGRTLSAAAQFARIVPGFKWNAYLRIRDLNPRAAVNVGSLKYARALADVLQRTSLVELRSYLRFELLSSQTDYLASAYRRIEYARADGGMADAYSSRSEMCVENTVATLPRESAALWRASHDVTGIERRANRVIASVRNALRSLIERANWLSPAMRGVLSRRLEATRVAFESEALPEAAAEPVLDRSDFAGNALALTRRHVLTGLQAIGLPQKGAGLLEIEPTDVDPFFLSQSNMIVLPWGMLTTPVLGQQASFASDLGSLGTIVGHEFVHALDPRWIADYEPNVAFRPRVDLAGYNERLACVAQELTEYRDLDGARLAPARVVDEAFADLGGAEAGYVALPRTDATSVRQFFAAFARVHASNVDRSAVGPLRDDDEHPPDRVRVDATLANMPEFALAFNCPGRAPMVHPPRVRCSAW